MDQFLKPFHCRTLCPLISKTQLSTPRYLAPDPYLLRDRNNAFDSASKNRSTIKPCPWLLTSLNFEPPSQNIIIERASLAFVNYKQSHSSRKGLTLQGMTWVGAMPCCAHTLKAPTPQPGWCCPFLFLSTVNAGP